MQKLRWRNRSLFQSPRWRAAEVACAPNPSASRIYASQSHTQAASRWQRTTETFGDQNGSLMADQSWTGACGWFSTTEKDGEHQPLKEINVPTQCLAQIKTAGLPYSSTGQRGRYESCRQAGRKRKRLKRGWVPLPKSPGRETHLLLGKAVARGSEQGDPGENSGGLWNWKAEKLLLYCHRPLSGLLTSSWNLAFPSVMKGSNKPDSYEQHMWPCQMLS